MWAPISPLRAPLAPSRLHLPPLGSRLDLPHPGAPCSISFFILHHPNRLERKGSGKFIAPKGASAKPKEDKQPLPGPAEIITNKEGNIIPDKDGEYPAFYEKSAWQPMMKSILNWMSNDEFCPSTCVPHALPCIPISRWPLLLP